MTCANCGAKLTCGCQKRVAANGKQCCQTCVASCNQVGGPKQAQPYIKKLKGPYTPHS